MAKIKTPIGKILITPRGAWNSTDAYEVLDIVTNDGSSYLALKAVPAGTLLSNTEYWMMLAEKGQIGEIAESYPFAQLTGLPEDNTNLNASLSGKMDADKADFKIPGTVSASGYTLTDSRINSEHWEVDWIYFATPSNVTSQIHWTTNIVNHTVTLAATYAGATNVIVNMHWVQ